MKAFLAAGAWFTAAVALVVGAVVALSWAGFLDRISILFYRGLVLIAVGELFCFAVLLLARRIWPILARARRRIGVCISPAALPFAC